MSRAAMARFVGNLEDDTARRTGGGDGKLVYTDNGITGIENIAR